MTNLIELPQLCTDSNIRMALDELYRCTSWEKAVKYVNSLENSFVHCLVMSESDPKKMCHLSDSELCDYGDRKRKAEKNRFQYVKKTCLSLYDLHSWETASGLLTSLPFSFSNQVILSCDTQRMPYLAGKELQRFWQTRRAVYLKNVPELRTQERANYLRDYFCRLCSSQEEANAFLTALLPYEAKDILLSCDTRCMSYLTDETQQSFWKQKRETYLNHLKKPLTVEKSLIYLYDHCFSPEEARAFLEPLGTNFCRDVFSAYDQKRNLSIYVGLRDFRTAVEKEAAPNTSFTHQDISNPHDFLYDRCAIAWEAFDFLTTIDKDTRDQIILDCDTSKMPYLTGGLLKNFWKKKVEIYSERKQANGVFNVEDANNYLRKHCSSEEEAQHFLNFLPGGSFRRKVILSCDGSKLPYLKGILMNYRVGKPLSFYRPEENLLLSQQYRTLYSMIKAANETAIAAGKPLHIILADCHLDRTALLTSSFVLHICQDLKIKTQFGAELFPEDSVTMSDGLEVFGFGKVKELAKEANKKNIWLEETDQHSTMPGKLRKNIQFLMQQALRFGMETFLTDPKGALDYTADQENNEDYRGMPELYHIREADMVGILDEKAAQGISVISHFGYAHIEELHKLIAEKENPGAYTLFIDPVNIGFLTNDRVHTQLANAKELTFHQTYNPDNLPVFYTDFTNCIDYAADAMEIAKDVALEGNSFIRLTNMSDYSYNRGYQGYRHATGSGDIVPNWQDRIAVPALVRSR